MNLSVEQLVIYKHAKSDSFISKINKEALRFFLVCTRYSTRVILSKLGLFFSLYNVESLSRFSPLVFMCWVGTHVPRPARVLGLSERSRCKRVPLALSSPLPKRINSPGSLDLLIRDAVTARGIPMRVPTILLLYSLFFPLYLTSLIKKKDTVSLYLTYAT